MLREGTLTREDGIVRSSRPLQGRVVLVTGASRRIAIGAAVVRRLVADGAAVLVHSWSAHDAEQPWGADLSGPEALVEELRSQGGEVEHVAADLSDPDAPARVVDAAHRAHGHLDVVVANHARSSAQALEQLSAEEIDLSYAVNTRATLLLVKAFAAQHDGRPGGRVVLFTSGQYHGAMPSELPYIASKGALHQLTPSLAAHLMPRGITVKLRRSRSERHWVRRRRDSGRCRCPQPGRTLEQSRRHCPSRGLAGQRRG